MSQDRAMNGEPKEAKWLHEVIAEVNRLYASLPKWKKRNRPLDRGDESTCAIERIGERDV